MKKSLLLLSSLIFPLLTMSGCDFVSNNSNNNSDSYNPISSDINSEVVSNKEATYVDVYPISYQQVNSRNDMDKFYAETKNSKGSSHDAPHDYGFVKSVWHTLKVNNKTVDVYSARCGYGIHSFAWVDISTDGLFELDVELQLSVDKYSKVTVLPEKNNINAEINGNIVTSKINMYGSFSFAFDEEAYMAMTLYVAPIRTLNVPKGYSVVNINPGYFDNSENNSLIFKQKNTVYYFKSGVYDITSISLPQDSIAYFERGCYMRVFEKQTGDYEAALGSNANNVQILGRALFDFSKCVGGDAKTKAVYGFSGDNLYVEGLTTINSNNWSLCFGGSDNAIVKSCMFFSYRTFSDGIMFSDCTNCYASDNFVRTGDDAVEVKSFTSTSAGPTNNVVFENNSVWTDKGLAYGCVYESFNDISNVYFKNNSVGFAQSSWSEHLGCCVIQMGNTKESTWKDIHFENIEIFKTSNAVMSLYNNARNDKEGGKIRDIYFKNITAKYVKQTNLPVYCLNIIIRIASGVDSRNSTIGNIYIDNVNYVGVDITKNNYSNYTNIALDDGAMFSKAGIKINTLNDQINEI